jgi:hypothetical protein
MGLREACRSGAQTLEVPVMSTLQLDHDLVATLAALETHRVEFVLVGDVAAAIYDDGGIVSSVAIVPGNYGRNVERLTHVLDTLNADMGIAGRADPRDLDWRHMDLREIAPCTFMTAYADIDIDFEPAGTAGYRDLFQDADRYEIAPGARPYVVSPDDLDRVMRGTGPKPVGPAARAYPPAPTYPPPPSYAEPSYPAAPPAAPQPLAADHAPPEPTMAPVPTPPSEAEKRAAEDDYDPGIWTEEEFNAIRSGRIRY